MKQERGLGEGAAWSGSDACVRSEKGEEDGPAHSWGRVFPAEGTANVKALRWEQVWSV